MSIAGEAEAVVVVKAAPQISQRHGETVCCAGVDLQGNWLRIYPVAFRTLDEGQKFSRWDRIRFNWRQANDDPRTESRRIDQQSLQIVGELRPSERERFLATAIVTGLDAVRQAGKSLALLRPQSPEFSYERKSDAEIASDRQRYEKLHKQKDLFNSKSIIPYEPCPFAFKYRYETDDGLREGTCQDWEIEATYFKWSRMYGEKQALAEMRRVFGEVYPEKGMLLAMGTHSRWPETWLINGVIRLDETKQLTLF